MAQKTGKFSISYAGSPGAPKTYEKESIFIGRLVTCEIVLDHKTVSRIHAGINFRDSKYILVNLSSSSMMTLNGRALAPQKNDVLADGDTVQIGPFTILVRIKNNVVSLNVQGQIADRIAETSVDAKAEAQPAAAADEMPDVLDVFWEKRTRDKEDWGTRLRPTEKPKPGKAMYNWRPTRDLRQNMEVRIICLGSTAGRSGRCVRIFQVSHRL